MGPKGKPVPPREPSESSHEEEEEEEDDDMTIQSVDPVEFMKSLPVEKRRRVYALKAITNKYREARKALRAQLDQLSASYMTSLEPLFDARRQIVNGEREATEAEIAAGTTADESHVEEVPSDDDKPEAAGSSSGDKKAVAEKKKSVKVTTPADNAAKAVLTAAAASPNGGIPGFWLNALRNNEIVESLITDKDAEALRSLIDITSIDLPDHAGFKIMFHFAENPFFSDRVLTKTYYTAQPSETDDGDEGDSIQRCEGCPISWRAPEKNLMMVTKQKKQRHKSGKGVRIITREERSPSFFWFFYPPYDPEDAENGKPAWYPAYAERKAEPEDDEQPWEDEEDMDFEMGIALHQNVVRRAAHYYTGKSVEEIAQGIMASMGGMGGGGEDEEEAEEEEEEEEEEEQPKPQIKGRGGAGGGAGGAPSKGGAAAAPAAKPAPKECKQQ